MAYPAATRATARAHPATPYRPCPYHTTAALHQHLHPRGDSDLRLLVEPSDANRQVPGSATMSVGQVGLNKCRGESVPATGLAAKH